MSRDVVLYENVLPLEIDEKGEEINPPRNLFYNTKYQLENEFLSKGEMKDENDFVVNIMEESCEVHVPQTDDNE